MPANPDYDKVELVPPQSIEAEQALLGALFLDSDYIPAIREILHSEKDFYRRAHQLIYVKMVQVYDAGDSVDWLVVSNRLSKSGDLEDVGGDAYLEEITASTPIAEGAEQYAAIVRDKATFRRVIAASTRIRSAAYDPTVEPKQLLLGVQEFADELAGYSATEIPNMNTLYDALDEQAREAVEEGIVPGWETGHPDLQELMLGWHTGGVSALAAPPGGGKTHFAFELLILFLLRNPDLSGAFITMEMTPFEIGSRQIVGDKFLSKAIVGKEDMGADHNIVKANIDAFRQRGRLQIAKPKSDSIESVKDLMRSLCQRGHKFIVWDYVQLADFEGRNEAEAAGKQLPKIKAVAEKYGVHILVLSQINKRSQEDSAVKFELQNLYGSTGSQLSNTAHNIFNCFQLHTQTDDPLCREIYTELKEIRREHKPEGFFDHGGLNEEELKARRDAEEFLWPKEILDRLVIQKVVKGRRGSRRFWAFWITRRDNRLKPLCFGDDELDNARVRSLKSALSKPRSYRRKH